MRRVNIMVMAALAPALVSLVFASASCRQQKDNASGAPCKELNLVYSGTTLHFSILLFLCLALAGCKQNESSWKPGMPMPKERIKIAVIHLNDINRNVTEL